MRDFVHDDILHPDFLFSRWLGLEENHFTVSDAAYVLHSTEIVFRANHMVHFGIGILGIHEIFVEFDGVVLDFEKFVTITRN